MPQERAKKMDGVTNCSLERVSTLVLLNKTEDMAGESYST